MFAYPGDVGAVLYYRVMFAVEQSICITAVRAERGNDVFPRTPIVVLTRMPRSRIVINPTNSGRPCQSRFSLNNDLAPAIETKLFSGQSQTASKRNSSGESSNEVIPYFTGNMFCRVFK